jgi:hypothetical protein
VRMILNFTTEKTGNRAQMRNFEILAISFVPCKGSVTGVYLAQG